MPASTPPSPKAKPERTRERAPRLTREDWLDAAFATVVEGGFDQARVLVLADRLKVTRGSFYWHFEDHAALITALLARWREQEMATHARLMQDQTEDAHADLVRLLEAALSHAGPNLENVRFELALRGLGRRDAEVARMLAEIDAQRMALFEHKFRRLGGEPAQARDLAALFYLAITGSNQALSRPNTQQATKLYLMDVITRYVIGPKRAA